MPKIVASLLIFGLLPLLGGPEEHKDFSGRWKMDPARSESAHQSVPVSAMMLRISQSPTEVTIETMTSEGQNSSGSGETLRYRLDGTESVITVASGEPIRTRARWDGPRLITETVRQINRMSVVVQNVFSLGPDKKELTVDRTLAVQHGYQSPSGNNTGTGKDVFVRVSGSDRRQAAQP